MTAHNRGSTAVANRRVARAVFGAVCLLAAVLQGATAAELPQYDGYVHQGVASCASGVCHGSATERSSTNVLQNEYVTWTRLDRHAQAYRTLLTEESQRMARNLGLPNAHEAAICLDCHADNVPAEQRGADFQISDGVGCEACHGGAENWLSSHTAPGASHQDNLDRGLYPTSSVEARAQLCLSCHLGTEDKFATHRIMGAGHPRLAFELSTFSALQPPHWAFDADYDQRKGIVSEFDTWTGGLMVAARESIALLQGPLLHGSGMFPEIALFDCHSCHQPMSSLDWQPTVLTEGLEPGAIRINDANFVLLLPLAEVLAGTLHDRMLQRIRELNQSVARSRDAVAAASRHLASLVDELESALAAGADQAARQQILRGVLNRAARGDYRDYVAAEQAAMAMDVLLISIERWEDVRESMDAVFATVENDEAYRPASFAAAADRLRRAL